MKSAKEEVEELMNALIPFAKQMLEKHGEFYPAGAALLPNGKVVMVRAYDDNEHPPSQEVIDDLLTAFRVAATKGEYKATALVFDILTIPPGLMKKTDAVAVRLDHVSGYSAQVAFPYRVTPAHEVVLSAPFASAGPADVFPPRR